MPRKDQLTDLKHLISLSPGEMRKQFSTYVYKDTDTVLRLLFRLIRTEKLTRQKKKNTLALTKFILEHYEADSVPSWLFGELKVLLKNRVISDIDKAVILSAFEPEELMGRLEGFEEFIGGFIEERTDFRDFIVEQISSNPSRLYDIYRVILEKSSPDGLLTMIEDLAGSEEREALQFMELITYHENHDVARAALGTIELASTQDAINTLYSISLLNDNLKAEAEEAYISLMYELPMPAVHNSRSIEAPDERGKKYVDLWVSLVDGNGALSVFIGKMFARNNYFFASVLLKLSMGIKDTILMSNLTRDAYNDIKKEHFSELNYYPVKEEYIIRLLQHFLKKGKKKGTHLPVEMVILKNILNWTNMEPVDYLYEVPKYQPFKYFPRDLFQFPFETWWMHDFEVYRILKPYKNLEPHQIPPKVFYKITKLFINYARREIVPMCELCVDIIKNSNYKKRTRLMRLFLIIRDELLNPPKYNYDSTFLNYAVFTTIHNTLHNISMGIESPEMIE